MAESYGYDEATRGRQQFNDTMLESDFTQSLPPTTEGISTAYSIMGSGPGGANSSVYAGALQAMQGAYGNRALQRYLGRGQAAPDSPYSIGVPSGEGISTISMDGMDAAPVQRSQAGQMSATSTPSGPSPVSSQPGPAQWLGGGVWMQPGPTTVGGYGHPQSGNGFFGYYEDTPYTFNLPGLPDPTLHDFEGGIGLDLLGTTFMGGNVSAGTWDGPDGGTRFGGKLAAGLLPGANLGSMDGAALAGNLEASVGTDGFTLGAGLTAGGVGGTAGDTFDKNSNTDTNIHFGVSEGPSLAARGHWGDSDKDGYNEYGFGFDAGPVTFDIKTEDPVRALVTGANPLNLLPDSINPFTNGLPQGNLTDKTMDGISAADDWLYDTMKGGVDSLTDWWYGDQGLEPF